MKKKIMGNKQKRAILITGIVLVAVIAVFLIAYFILRGAVNQVPQNLIAENIYIDNVRVAGMTAEEAKKALEAQVAEYQKETVKLVAEGTEAEVTLGDLGFQMKDLDDVINQAVSYGKKGSVWSRYQKIRSLEEQTEDFDVIYAIDQEKAKETITAKIPHLENEAKDATIKREDGKFVITDGAEGKKIDLDESVKVIQTYINYMKEQQETGAIELVTIMDKPDVTREQLEQIQSQLGTFSTSFTRGSNRGKNIAHAASKINGVVLMPGEEYSASDGMGARNAANGYLEAGSYLDGQTVQSYGGGVCQVSTTLYNAVILAELEITERWSHSMTVDYVKPSMDAAIAEGYKDLKFKNNTEAPVYIEGYTVGGKLTFTIYGKETRADGRKVSFVSEVTSRTAAKKKFVASGDTVGTLKKSASGHDAVKAKLWKVVTENGVEVSREAINTSSYQSSAATWKVGTGTDNQQAKTVLTNAIKTQNEATIKSAITEAQNLIKAAQQPATPPATEPTTPTTPSTDPDTPTQ